MKKLLFLIFIIGFGTKPSPAQPLLKFYQSNMVRVLDQNGNDLKNPFGGGLKFPVITSIDLNFDSRPDLVVIDRVDDRLLTFINEGGFDTVKYSYRPEFEDIFPNNLSRYVFLSDYNNDSKPDLFTFANSVGTGIELHRNISFGNKILFSKYIPDPMDPSNPALVSTFYGNDYKIGIPVKSSDIPAIIDADNDGDLDFFTFDELGGAFLWYFKNFSKELGAPSDSIYFEMVDSYWGYFMEADNTNLVQLGQKDAFAYKDYKMLMPASKRHSGSTVFVNDMNADSDLDLLVGDVGYPGIRYLINGKTDVQPLFDSIIAQDTAFPASKPVSIMNMPGVFNIDINNDGKKDYVFSPMDETIIDNKLVDGLNQVWYYKNSGNNNNPVLNYVKNNFLQEDMIDLGGGTSPAFFDYDGDHDADLFIATRGNHMQTKWLADRIVLYENVGTAQKPVFQKKNDNYLNLSAAGYKSVTLNFGDLDDDGDMDILMGNSTGRLIWYKNDPVNDSAVFSYVTNYFDSIDVGDYSTPFIADIDKDSEPDLIIGAKGGRLSHWKYNGGSTPDYSLLTDTFGGIIIPFGDHYMAPCVVDIDTNGHPDMVLSYNNLDPMIGLVKSNVCIYRDIDLQSSKPYISTDTIFYNISSGLPVQKFIGRKLHPASIDLDGDRLPDLLFGCDRGGLLFYGTNTSLSTQITVTGKTTLCPGDSAILDAGTGFDSYSWNTGQKTQKIVVYTAGSYNCLVTKGSFSYKAYVSIQMHSGITKADFTFLNNDLTVSFTALASNIDSVHWTFGDGNYSNDINPVHTYSSAGNYTVCLEIFDNCGAKADTCISIYLTGINDNLKFEFSLFPNPTENIVNIKCNQVLSGQSFLMDISDILGRKIIHQEIILQEEMTINMSTFIPGTYTLMLSDVKGNVCKKAVLVKVGQ